MDGRQREAQNLRLVPVGVGVVAAGFMVAGFPTAVP
jgi:hypothetical protein